MAQTFSRLEVLAVKVFLIALALLLFAAVALMGWRMSATDVTFDAVQQPIPFSHKHHVGDIGLDCRYCHTTVEKSSTAGLPSTQICLSCHSQLFKDVPALAPLHASALSGVPIQWNRVHDLPDFVYFDHSIHVNKGVACIECHGHIDQMPLTSRVVSLDMQWCLQCHRSASQHIRPLTEVFSMRRFAPLSKNEIEQLDRLYRLQDTRRLTDCSTCHR
jgi:hypothetical protein